MELNFPFRNYVYNSLVGFFKSGFIYSFATSNLSVEDFLKEDFDSLHYVDRIPSFQNELLQVIDTTNQETIDIYFNELKTALSNLKYWFDEKQVIAVIDEWNQKQLDSFNAEVEKKTEEYFLSTDRKRSHLEEFEASVPFGFFSYTNPTFKKIVKTNHNFYCVEEKLKQIDYAVIPSYLLLLKHQLKMFVTFALKYIQEWEAGNVKEKFNAGAFLKPILFCEGQIDIDLISKAAELLGKQDLLNKIEIRQRGSCSNLDKLWKILTDDNWETVPQTKILLYDCDTNRPDEDFGHIFRRTIPKIDENPIERGIENLFSIETITKARDFKNAFFDINYSSGTERGIAFDRSTIAINHQEKRNFCTWALANGMAEDFAGFSKVFEIIEALV